MLRGTERPRNLGGRYELGPMALPVIHAERMATPALGLRHREHGSRVEPPGEKNDGGLHATGNGRKSATQRGEARASLARGIGAGEARDDVLERVARAARIALIGLDRSDGEQRIR